MVDASGWLLVGAVAAVGVLHTIVPDHWVPITLIARQRGWSQAKTLRAALIAGTGHVLSTLAIAAVIWIGGVAVATRFGQWVDTIASLALIGFGGWIAIGAWRALHRHDRHGHGHDHGHHHGHSHADAQDADPVHGPERQRLATAHGVIDVSIFEAGAPPRFRLSGALGDATMLETVRDDGARQRFAFRSRGAFLESIDTIPEPHQFDIRLTTAHAGHAQTCNARFTEHANGHHRHSHGHAETVGSRTALLLILGSSPMVEGIPAFFAAAKYGVALILVMALVFALTTIATYVALCVGSTTGLQRVSLGPLERYGEVLSGAFIATVGLVFWVWPVL